MEWVLRRTSVAEVAARLEKQREEDGLDDEGGIGPSGGTNGNRRGGGALAERAGTEVAGEGGGGDEETVNPGNGNNAGDGSLATGDHSGTAPVVITGGSSPQTVATISEAAAAAAAALVPSKQGGYGANKKKDLVTPTDVEGAGTEEVDDGEEDDVADRFAAIFEFLRSGNSLLLPPDLRADWESRPDIGLGLLSADDHEDDLVRGFSRQISANESSQPRPESSAGVRATVTSAAADGSSPPATEARNLRHPQQHLTYNLIASGGSRKGVSAWARGLCREATGGDGEPMTYHDLRMALNTTAPKGRRSETTNDLLERRLAERRNRADEMATALWGNDRPGATENLYRPSTSVVAAK